MKAEQRPKKGNCKMKILNVEWKAFCNDDMKDAFRAEGHCVVSFSFPKMEDTRNNPKVEEALSSVLHKEAPDAVFSFNYYPVISKVCAKEGVRYISWIYDCPHISLYSYTILNSCNTVYVFDKELYLEFHHAGIPTVHYLPLAANVERLDKMEQGGKLRYLYDISMVGALYTEVHRFFDRMKDLPDYTRGYLDALMAAQMKVQGYNFIQESLEPVMDALYQALPLEPNPDGAETKEYLYAQYVINRKITGMERTALLTGITGNHTFDLFTFDDKFVMPNLRNHGFVEPYDQMPRVFKQSRINLNITLRSIKSGIPLRGFDILGAGGFLLSNFQADFLDIFVPGEDFVYYESMEDLLQKIDYYLVHEDEREAIAKHGHDKVSAGHTFRHRVREILEA